MALLICLDCTTAFAVGVLRCPQCGSERAEEQGTDPYRGGTMPKINPLGEPTFAADLDTEGGEEPSAPTEAPGTSSPTSTEKQETSPETSSTGRQKRARGTGSRSKKTGEENSSAGSTDTGGPETAAAEQD